MLSGTIMVPPWRCLFAALKAKGPLGKEEGCLIVQVTQTLTPALILNPHPGKKKEEGCQFVQPGMLTSDGQTRVLYGAGTKETCGSLKDRFRMGEQIKWGPWGNTTQNGHSISYPYPLS